jgi:hypothetical protein
MDARAWISLVADLAAVMFGILGVVLYFVAERLNRRTGEVMAAMSETVGTIKELNLNLILPAVERLASGPAQHDLLQARDALKDMLDRAGSAGKPFAMEDQEALAQVVHTLEERLDALQSLVQGLDTGALAGRTVLPLHPGLTTELLFRAWQITRQKLSDPGTSLYVTSLVEILQGELSISVTQARNLVKALLDTKTVRVERDPSDKETILLA